jgi:hypothetical protein
VLRTSEKKIGRMIDVRKTLLGAAPWDDGDARRRLDWDGGQTVTFRIAVGPQGSARPVEALTALFGEDVAGRADVARLRLTRRPPPRDRDRALEQALRRHVAVSELSLRVEAGR